MRQKMFWAKGTFFVKFKSRLVCGQVLHLNAGWDLLFNLYKTLYLCVLWPKKLCEWAHPVCVMLFFSKLQRFYEEHTHTLSLFPSGFLQLWFRAGTVSLLLVVLIRDNARSLMLFFDSQLLTAFNLHFFLSFSAPYLANLIRKPGRSLPWHWWEI